MVIYSIICSLSDKLGYFSSLSLIYFIINHLLIGCDCNLMIHGVNDVISACLVSFQRLCFVGTSQYVDVGVYLL